MELVRLSGFSLPVAIASEPIRRRRGLGWTGKAQNFKRSRPFRLGRVLGRSWQTCAEAASHPVKNSVIAMNCEGFGGASRPSSTAACDNGPHVARFLVKSDGLDYRSGPNRPGERLDNKELMSWRSPPKGWKSSKT